MFDYASCRLCPRSCGVNRSSGERGVCGMGAELVLARAALHHWEEPCVSGKNGSGAIFFSGCPLHCIYCQNHQIANGRVGKTVSEERLTDICFELASQGAHNINLVTATHYAPTVLKAIECAKARGLALPIVWNTSGYESVDTLRMLGGKVDIYLTDLRYMKKETAACYSRAPEYPGIAWNAISEMVSQTGSAEFDETGMLKRGVIVRLLLLPGAVAEAKLALLKLHKTYGDQILISLMQQYTPMPGVETPLDRRVTPKEYASLVRYAEELGVTNAYVQEREAAEESFIPPFDGTGL